VGGVDYSVYVVAPSAGLSSVNLLRAPTTLVGVVFTGQYVGIVLDAVRTAYVPGISFNGISAVNGFMTPVVPVSWSFSGLSMNVVYQSSGQVVVFFFGTAMRGAVSLDAYSGVTVSFSASNGGTAPANLTASAVAQFPQGSIRLTGAAYFYLDTNVAYDVWSFTSAGGLLIQGMGVTNIGAGGGFSVLPLDDVFTAQSLSVTVNMYSVAAGKSHSGLLILYYRF